MLPTFLSNQSANLPIHGRHSKQPPTSKKFTGLTKLLLSHFHNVVHVISSLPQHSTTDEGRDGSDVEMTILVLHESAKLLPYVIGSRKAVKVYLKVRSQMWTPKQFF